MPRCPFFLVLASILLCPSSFLAASEGDDGPPIAITSPETGTTFAYASVKDHALIWNKNKKVLIARITFTDASQDSGQFNDDTHEFTLPGVTLDSAKGIFFATSAKGESIPVAHFKKALFFTVIETLPNAAVRILHPRGNITVILEAISPNDPAMHAPPDANSDGSHKVDIDKILN